MATNSKIQWTHHTFNPWRGCTKVSDGCKNCYAETMSKRNPKVLGIWGENGTRVVASDSMWREPHKWNAAAEKAGERHRVFCASLADVCEDRPELVEPRSRLRLLIDQTPHLNWLLLTKRPENFGMLFWDSRSKWPSNVWAGTSCEDQKTADERIPHLLRAPAAVRFLSCEPLLGPIDLEPHLTSTVTHHMAVSVGGALRNKSFVGFTDGGRSLSKSEAEAELRRLDAAGVKLLSMGGCDEFSSETGCPGHRNPCIDWVIAGGESGPHARQTHIEWHRSIRDQCKAAGVPYFLKQLGANVHGLPCPTCGIVGEVEGPRGPMPCPRCYGLARTKLADPKGGDMSEWPEDLRAREFPTGE